MAVSEAARTDDRERGGPKISPAQEYEMLRAELSESKRYIFERPVIIVTAGAALMAVEGGVSSVFLPSVLVGLLLFNLWFTANRLASASRIVAYVHVVLEGSIPWVGWETSLRRYRNWMRSSAAATQSAIDQELNNAGAPDALMYYPPIHRLHSALVIFSAALGLETVLNNPTRVGLVATVALCVLALVFGACAWRWRPSRFRNAIERNILIWKRALV